LGERLPEVVRRYLNNRDNRSRSGRG
jgi:hypothetical protein